MKKVIKRMGLLLPVLLVVFALLPSVASAEGNEASVTAGETVTPYATFLEAVSAANASEGSTLTLLQDVTVDSTVEITSADLTLDLNGFQIFETIGYSVENPILRVASGAKLTVTDMSNAQTGEIGKYYDYHDNNTCPGIGNNGTLILDGGTVTGYYGIRNTGTLILNGGLIRCSSQGTSERGVQSISGVVIGYAAATIDNGILAQNTTVEFYGTQVRDVDLEGGSIYAEDCDFRRGKSHLNFSANNTDVELHNCKIGCLIAMSLTNCTTELTGCTVEGGEIFSEGCMGIHGGSFTAYNCSIRTNDKGRNTFTISDGATVSVYGATFTNGIQIGGGVLKDVLPEGWDYTDKDGNPITFADTDTKTADNETYYIHQQKVATVTDADGNTTRYLTLADAVAAAQTLPGSTVKPLENIELDSMIEITSGTFTLDLNGYTVEYGADAAEFNGAIEFKADEVSLTIKDSSSTGEGRIKGPHYAVKLPDNYRNCYLQIDGGSFEGEKIGSLFVTASKTVINDGRFEGKTVAVLVGSLSNVTINGGYFVGEENTFSAVQNSGETPAVITLYGGIFEDGINMYCSWMDLNDLPGRCYFYVDAQGNKVIPNDGDMENSQVYTLRKFVEATVTVGDETTEYPYLSEALAAAEANPGSVLKLQKDFDLSAPVEITTGGFTFDMNGYTLSAGEQDAIQVAENASLTLLDTADEPGSLGSVNNAGSLRLENVSGSDLVSSGEVTFSGTVALPEGVVLTGGAQLKLDGLVGTDTYTVELQDADDNFATGEFAFAADGSALGKTDAARFASTCAPGYVVATNADGKLEIVLVTVEIMAGVIWEDSENADGIRPESVAVAVQRDGQTVAMMNISEGTDVFVLAKFDGETEIAYTLAFPDVEGYEKKVDGNAVTYTHVPAPTQPPATNGSANTADFAMPGLWAMAMLAGIMGAVAVCKRKEI